MQLPSKYFQDIKLLQILVKYSNSDLDIEVENENMWKELNKIFPNNNLLEKRMYELNNEGIINYEEIGEEGFAPIIIATIKKETHFFLTELIEKAEIEVIETETVLKDLLTFDPDVLTQNIEKAQNNLTSAKKEAENNELLKPILKPIEQIEKHFKSVAAVSQIYDDVYKNIIRPIQKEGEAGVKQTVKWAIISIIVSTILSIIIGNWKSLYELL
ncbi:hypothetical protein VXP84_07355 [Acinetobacter oleivorans]|uniref:hypothetical protein n=1 Tax=Acinetobacter oleivorans TaxID=1148157 RepID=UPI003A8C772D